LSKIKYFICHQHVHYESQCLEKKGKGKQQQKKVVASTKTHIKRFVAKFEKYFLLVYFLSTSIVPTKSWYMDSGESQHMTSSWKLFYSLNK
jgi:hypothetical protein